RQSPWSVADMAEDVRQRWLQLREQQPGPWGLFSVSLGGMVAVRWCASHPEDFQNLVVTNSSASNLSPLFDRFLPSQIGNIPRFMLETNAHARERQILHMTTSGRTPVDALATKQAEYALPTAKFRETGIRQLYAASRYKMPERLAVPTLVL